LPDTLPSGGPWWDWRRASCLVALNGFFVAAEFALVKIRPTQLQPRLDRDELQAKMTHRVLSQLDSYLSAAQLGITLASLALVGSASRRSPGSSSRW